MFFKNSQPHSKPKSELELKGAIHLRKLRITLFSLFLFYVPFVAFMDSIMPSEKISIAFAIIYFCTMAFVGIWYNFSKCPRCNNFFGWKWYYGNGFTNKCLHCGLSIRKKDLKTMAWIITNHAIISSIKHTIYCSSYFPLKSWTFCKLSAFYPLT